MTTPRNTSTMHFVEITFQILNHLLLVIINLVVFIRTLIMINSVQGAECVVFTGQDERAVDCLQV